MMHWLLVEAMMYPSGVNFSFYNDVKDIMSAASWRLVLDIVRMLRGFQLELDMIALSKVWLCMLPVRAAL